MKFSQKIFTIPIWCALSFMVLYPCKKNVQERGSELVVNRIPGITPRNVICILSDEHRCDFIGFMGNVPGLEFSIQKTIVCILRPSNAKINLTGL